MVLAGLMWTKMFSGGLMCVKIEVRSRHFAKKKIHTGSGSWVTSRPKPKTKINLGSDLEFNSHTFWYRNQQTFKMFDTQKCLDLNNVRKI